MSTFNYTCKDVQQKIVKGTIEAESISAAISMLTRQGLFPVNVTPQSALGQSKAKHSSKSIPVKNITVFTRQLCDLLGSGISLLRSLEIIDEQTIHPGLKTVVTTLIKLVKDGHALSCALETFPKTFSKLYVNLVKSGEASGTLEAVLRDLSESAEYEEDIRNQVKSAAAYPLFVIAVGFVTFIVLMSFVVPKISAIFLEIDQPLPLITKILVFTSSVFNKFWWLILLAVFAAAVFINRQKNKFEGKHFADRLLLSIPVVNSVYRNNQIGKFCRNLSNMLHNGVHIINALEIVRDIVFSESFKKEISNFTAGIKKGTRLGHTLKESSFIPLSTKNIIAVGEESGSLEEALGKAGIIHEKEMNRTLKLATALLEPVLILGVGLFVGFIVLAMLWPIFQINVFMR